MNNDLNTNKIDKLGALLAEIADLTAEANAIKEGLKDIATAPGSTEKVFEGALFKATFTETNRGNVNYKKLFAALGISSEVIAKYTETTAVFSIKVGAR